MVEELLGLARTPEEQKLVYAMVRRARVVDPRFGQAINAVQGISVPPPQTAPPSTPTLGTLEALSQIVAEIDHLTHAIQQQRRRPVRILFTRDGEGRIVEAIPEY